MRSTPVAIVVALAAVLGVAPVAAASAAPARTPRFACGGRYHQIATGPDSAVLILQARAISCPTVTGLARALLRGDDPTPTRPATVIGYVCRSAPIKAGGGAARCTRGQSMVLFGFE